jgi:hypothetical protein
MYGEGTETCRDEAGENMKLYSFYIKHTFALLGISNDEMNNFFNIIRVVSREDFHLIDIALKKISHNSVKLHMGLAFCCTPVDQA